MQSSVKAGYGRIVLSIALIAVLLVIASAVLFYIGSDHYKATRDFSRAKQHVQQKHFGEALRLYKPWFHSTTTFQQAAQQHIRTLLTLPELNTISAAQFASLLAQTHDIRAQFSETLSGVKVLPLASAAIARDRETDPRGAKDLINELIILTGDSSEWLEQKAVLLQRIVKADPQDVGSAVELAEYYEIKQDRQNVEQLLAPHKDNLADGEGARLYGQLAAGRGDIETAYALLKAYTGSRLEAFRQAEQAYNNIMNVQWDEALAELRAGKASNRFYDEYDRAGKQQQEQMVNAYVRTRMQNAPQVEQLREKYRQTARVVPVALDLGVVTLSRAQNTTDGAQRTNLLNEAERVFLSVQGVASDSPDFQFYLGQVYYWLGRFAEGKTLFEKLLERSQRNYATLMTVASNLREVGEYQYARQLSEEAFAKASSTAERNAAARLRSVMQKDTDDAIFWLNRADRNDPDIQIALNNNMAMKAEENGQYAKALDAYRKVAAAYQHIPETAATLNNAALVYFSIARLSKDPDAKAKGIEMMDKAVSLNPSNSITLANAANALIVTAMSDTVGDQVKYDKLMMSPSPGMLQYLYANQAQKNQYVTKLSVNPAFTRGKSYLHKVMLLSPKSSDAFSELYGLLYFMGAKDELEQLVSAVMNIDYDFADAQKSAEEYYAGKKDQELLQRITTQIKDIKARMPQLDKQKDKISYAIAQNKLSSLYMAGANLGQTVDANVAVQLNRDAWQSAPSSATNGSLIEALHFRIAERLSKQHPVFNRLNNQVKRKLNDSERIILAVLLDPALKEKLVADADYREIVKLMTAMNGHFDGSWTVHEWLLLSWADPVAAEQVKQAMRNDKRFQVATKATRKFADSSPSAVLNNALMDYFEGKIESGQQLLNRIVGRSTGDKRPAAAG